MSGERFFEYIGIGYSLVLLLGAFNWALKRVNRYLQRKAGITPVSLRQLTIVYDRETDGRWIAEVPELPGVMVYGTTQKDARDRVGALAAVVLYERDRQEQREYRP
jgi:predicted RNase H-like HicB family nuclease